MDIAAIAARAPVIPVLTIERLADAVPLARALVKGGLSVLEITFRTGVALEALAAIAREVPDWSGGTRIGESLRVFNQEWALRMLNKHTIVLIMSDGLDTGDASVLEHEMEQIQRRAARVIWLNPLLGNEDYRPLARGMSAALPHVNLFASAHNLASLQALGRHLAL